MKHEEEARACESKHVLFGDRLAKQILKTLVNGEGANVYEQRDKQFNYSFFRYIFLLDSTHLHDSRPHCYSPSIFFPEKVQIKRDVEDIVTKRIIFLFRMNKQDAFRLPHKRNKIPISRLRWIKKQKKLPCTLNEARHRRVRGNISRAGLSRRRHFGT